LRRFAHNRELQCQALGNDAQARWRQNAITYGGAVSTTSATTAGDTFVFGYNNSDGVFMPNPTITPKTKIYNYGFTGSTDPNAPISPEEIYTTVAHEETHATPLATNTF
jgi:hypothetical protein